MKTFVTVLATIAVLSITGLIFAFSGLYNVSAREPHWNITRWFLHVARDRSVTFHKSAVKIPSDTDGMINSGFSHFHAMCRRCHGAPGHSPEEFALGMYPKPPVIPSHHQREPGAYHWIIANGFKMTGMPAFGQTHDEKEILSLVAFVGELPEIGAEGYRRLLEEAEARGGGHGHTHGEEANGTHEEITEKAVKPEKANGSAMEGSVEENESREPGEDSHEHEGHSHDENSHGHEVHSHE